MGKREAEAFKLRCGLQAGRRLRPPAATSKGARFEDEVAIDLRCCGESMVSVGNLSLRGPASCTSLGYECKKCFRRVMVVDEWWKTDPSLQDVEP